jgi:hypothetical protein
MNNGNQIDLGTKVKLAKLAYLWCVSNLKKSKYHNDVPRLIVRSSKKSNSYKGYYKENKNIIVVFSKNHKSILDICETIIHEWKHYQQNISGMYDKYIVLYRRNIKNHPYEITAENFAKKHANECRKFINRENKIKK